MDKLQGSKTEKNLFAAFAGETQARVKYSFFEKKAKEEGYEEISKIFKAISENECTHAQMWFKYLCGEIGDTLGNLKDAMSGEKYESGEMYPEFAKEAQEEGFEEIAELFKKVGNIEDHHYQKFSQLAKEMENGEIFTKKDGTVWQCEKCGYLEQGDSAPTICPVCGYPQGNFKEKEK